MVGDPHLVPVVGGRQAVEEVGGAVAVPAAGLRDNGDVVGEAGEVVGESGCDLLVDGRGGGVLRGRAGEPGGHPHRGRVVGGPRRGEGGDARRVGPSVRLPGGRQQHERHERDGDRGCAPSRASELAADGRQRVRSYVWAQSLKPLLATRRAL